MIQIFISSYVDAAVAAAVADVAATTWSLASFAAGTEASRAGEDLLSGSMLAELLAADETELGGDGGRLGASTASSAGSLTTIDGVLTICKFVSGDDKTVKHLGMIFSSAYIVANMLEQSGIHDRLRMKLATRTRVFEIKTGSACTHTHTHTHTHARTHTQ